MQRLREGARKVYDTTKRAANRAGHWCARHPYATMGTIFVSSLLIKGTVDHAGDIANYFHNLSASSPPQHIEGKVLFHGYENKGSSGTDYYNNLYVCTSKGVSTLTVHTDSYGRAEQLKEALKPGDFVRADVVGSNAVNIQEDSSLVGTPLDTSTCDAYVRDKETREDTFSKVFCGGSLAFIGILGALIYKAGKPRKK